MLGSWCLAEGSCLCKSPVIILSPFFSDAELPTHVHTYRVCTVPYHMSRVMSFGCTLTVAVTCANTPDSTLMRHSIIFDYIPKPLLVSDATFQIERSLEQVRAPGAIHPTQIYT